MRYPQARAVEARALGSVLAACVLLGAGRAAWAQGLSAADATALGRQHHQASAALDLPNATPGVRVGALRTLADATRELAERLRDPRFVQPGAEAAYRARTGIGFHGAEERAARALERCVDEVRTTHALDNNARSCLRGAPSLGNPPVYFAHAAPLQFARARGGGDEASAWYVRMETRLRATPDDYELRLNIGAMELESGDYYTAASTLSRLRGDYAAELTSAVALARSGRALQADQLLTDLARREPNRPEAHFNLGQLLSDPNARGVRGTRVTLISRALTHYRAYLCTRDHAVLASPADAHRHAAEQAVDLMTRLHGDRQWQPGQALPRPIVPPALLPSDMATPRGHGVSPPCASLVEAARDSAVRFTAVAPQTNARGHRHHRSRHHSL